MTLLEATLAAALMSAAAGALAGPQEPPAAAPRPWFRDATDTSLPPRDSGGRHSMDAVAADLDGDGDLDLAVPQEWHPNKLLLNDGKGTFTDVSARLPALADAELAKHPSRGHDSEDVSVADFDGDGRPDLVFASEDDVKLGRTPVHEYYRSAGAEGGYVRVAGQLPDTEANAVAHGDLTGDGRPDLLLSGFGQDRLLVNDGKGRFRDETGARLPRDTSLAQDAAFVDVDGDADLDIVLALEGGHGLWINDGKGRFREETEARLPAPGADVEARKVAWADVDRDGDVDLYFAHVGWQGRAPQDRLMLNDGKGKFTDATSGRLPEDADTTLAARFADFDRDGDVDLVRSGANVLQVLENDGTGRFTDVSAARLPRMDPGVAIAIALEVADFDRDGLLDLYVGMLGAGPNPPPGSFDRLLLGVR